MNFRLGTIAAILAGSVASACAQGHGTAVPDALRELSWMAGEWRGSQTFNTGGAPMSGDAVDHVGKAIGGRYIEERLSTTLPGRKPSDTRHLLTYDPTQKHFRAWWFNDSSVGAMELAGDLDGSKLVLVSKPTDTGSPAPVVFRATYERVDGSHLGYKLEIQTGDTWRELFHTVYSRVR